ncbi:Cell division control protein 45 homolog (Suppressor of nda4 protein) [Durusdinium trenchii]|uniref:Cell division control protein 45 homolog (Suppressor of nda4 protein) n=1 Tax=Durusdinium trenchii TaxID=1381693 RepID=A0ABP0RWB7_9DINO
MGDVVHLDSVKQANRVTKRMLDSWKKNWLIKSLWEAGVGRVDAAGKGDGSGDSDSSSNQAAAPTSTDGAAGVSSPEVDVFKTDRTLLDDWMVLSQSVFKKRHVFDKDAGNASSEERAAAEKVHESLMSAAVTNVPAYLANKGDEDKVFAWMHYVFTMLENKPAGLLDTYFRSGPMLHWYCHYLVLFMEGCERPPPFFFVGLPEYVFEDWAAIVGESTGLAKTDLEAIAVFGKRVASLRANMTAHAKRVEGYIQAKFAPAWKGESPAAVARHASEMGLRVKNIVRMRDNLMRIMHLVKATINVQVEDIDQALTSATQCLEGINPSLPALFLFCLPDLFRYWERARRVDYELARLVGLTNAEYAAEQQEIQELQQDFGRRSRSRSGARDDPVLRDNTWVSKTAATSASVRASARVSERKQHEQRRKQDEERQAQEQHKVEQEKQRLMREEAAERSIPPLTVKVQQQQAQQPQQISPLSGPPQPPLQGQLPAPAMASPVHESEAVQIKPLSQVMQKGASVPRLSGARIQPLSSSTSSSSLRVPSLKRDAVEIPALSQPGAPPRLTRPAKRSKPISRLEQRPVRAYPLKTLPRLPGPEETNLNAVEALADLHARFKQIHNNVLYQIPDRLVRRSYLQELGSHIRWNNWQECIKKRSYEPLHPIFAVIPFPENLEQHALQNPWKRNRDTQNLMLMDKFYPNLLNFMPTLPRDLLYESFRIKHNLKHFNEVKPLKAIAKVNPPHTRPQRRFYKAGDLGQAWYALEEELYEIASQAKRWQEELFDALFEHLYPTISNALSEFRPSKHMHRLEAHLKDLPVDAPLYKDPEIQRLIAVGKAELWQVVEEEEEEEEEAVLARVVPGAQAEGVNWVLAGGRRLVVLVGERAWWTPRLVRKGRGEEEMLWPSGRLEEVYLNIREVALDGGCTVIIYVALDCDALCTCKIITSLLKTDNVSYKLKPVRWHEDIVSDYRMTSEQQEVRSIVMINCGGDIGIEETLGLSDATFCYIIDSHRPFNHINLLPTSTQTIVLADSAMNESALKRSALELGKLSTDEVEKILMHHDDDDSDSDDSDSGSEGESDKGAAKANDQAMEEDAREEEEERELSDLEREERSDQGSDDEESGKDVENENRGDALAQSRTRSDAPQNAMFTQAEEDDFEREVANEAKAQEAAEQQRLRAEAAMETVEDDEDDDDGNDDGGSDKDNADGHEGDGTESRRGAKRKLSQSPGDTSEPSKVRREEDGDAVGGVGAHGQSPRRKVERDARSERVFSYYRGSWWGTPAAHVAFVLAQQLNMDNKVFLWLAIMGSTFHFLQNQTESEDYATLQMDYENLVKNRMLNASSMRAEDGTMIPVVDQEAISLVEEYRLMLHRHWSLREAFFYSDYVASKLGIWRADGTVKLDTFFAKMGISLKESKQKFAFMSKSVKESLRDKIEEHGEAFGLDQDFVYGSFQYRAGYGRQLSAADAVFCVSALLDSFSLQSTIINGWAGSRSNEQARDDLVDARMHHSVAAQQQRRQQQPEDGPADVNGDLVFDDSDGGNEGAKFAVKYRQAWQESFNVAYDALDFASSGDIIEQGLTLAKSLQMAIVEEGGSIIAGSKIQSAGNFRYAVLDGLAPKLVSIFSQPQILLRLAQFLVLAYTSAGKWRNESAKPLVLGVKSPRTETAFLVGIPCTSDAADGSRVNKFGMQFREAAQRIEASFRHSGFESAAVQIPVDHVQKFVLSLHEVMLR